MPQKKEHRWIGLLGLAFLAPLVATGCSPIESPAAERDELGHLLPYEDLAAPYMSMWGLGETRSPEMIDENSFVIYFSSPQGPTCTRHNTETVETDESITITLFNGLVANHADVECPTDLSDMEGPGGTMVVDLESPIGDRELINGATGEVVQVSSALTSESPDPGFIVTPQPNSDSSDSPSDDGSSSETTIEELK